MGAPVFFRQSRPGRDGKAFTLLKFRTMKGEPDGAGALPDGERLTSLGILLRRASLDELPELINVLRGEMSLVGPRPLLMEYLPLYNPEQGRRHEVLPGITGWAQVNGRNGIGWEEKFKLDIWYVDHHSFMLDLRILWMTVVGVFGAKGISHPGHATMERFRGTGN
jgi:sugar transferase EpsL